MRLEDEEDFAQPCCLVAVATSMLAIQSDGGAHQRITSMGFLAVAIIVSATSVMSALLTQKD